MPSFLEREQLLTTQPYIANVDAISRTFQTKLQYWSMGASQVKSAYQNYLGLDLTREDNQKKLNEYMQVAKEGIKKASTTDLSVGDNVNTALGVFDPITKDKNIMGDYSITRHYKNQLGVAESYRNRDGGKEYSDNNLRYLQMKLNDFRIDASADNWQDHASKKGYYTPYYDYSAEIKTAMENYKPSEATSTMPTAGGKGYLSTTTDKSWRENDIKNYLSGVLSDKAKKQMGIDGFVAYGQNYSQLGADMSNHIQGIKQQTRDEIARLQFKLDKQELTDEEKDIVQQQLTRKLNSQFDLTKQQEKMRDPKYIKDNYEKVVGYYTQNQLISSSSKAFTHEVRSETMKPDEWQMTILREAGDDRRLRMRIGADLQMNVLNNQTKMQEKMIDAGLGYFDLTTGRFVSNVGGVNDTKAQLAIDDDNTTTKSYDSFLKEKQGLELQNAQERKNLKDDVSARLGKKISDVELDQWIVDEQQKVNKVKTQVYTDAIAKGVKKEVAAERAELAAKRIVGSPVYEAYKKTVLYNDIKLEGYKKIYDDVLENVKKEHPELTQTLNAPTGNRYLDIGAPELAGMEQTGGVRRGVKVSSSNPLTDILRKAFDEKYNSIDTWKQMSNPKDPRYKRAVNLAQSLTEIPADFKDADIAIKPYNPRTGEFAFSLGQEKMKKMKDTEWFDKIKNGSNTNVSWNEKNGVFIFKGDPSIFKVEYPKTNEESALKEYFDSFNNQYKPGSKMINSDFHPYQPDKTKDIHFIFEKTVDRDNQIIYSILDANTKKRLGNDMSLDNLFEAARRLSTLPEYKYKEDLKNK